MAKIPSFGISFISTSGGADILNAHATTWGPSWRMIVEMTADGPIGQGIYPGGQSGHPGSKYYMNMVEDWRLGKYRNLQFVKSETEIKIHFLHSILNKNEYEKFTFYSYINNYQSTVIFRK